MSTTRTSTTGISTTRPVRGTRARAGAVMLGTIAAATIAAAATGAPAAAADTSKVSVVHGIPGATVDVYVNGERTLDDFAPGTVAGPLDLPAGSYDLKVVAGNAPDGNADAVVEANDVEVPGGANISVVAHLNAEGQPILTPFVNDVSRVGAGKARLIVRHTAAAPAVDVRANGQVAFPGLTNPKEAKADLPAGSIRADVVLAGTSTVALGPATLNLREGTATIVYATGSAEQRTLRTVAQVIPGLHSNPSGVPAGLGGSAGRDGIPAGILLVGGLGLLMTAGAATRLAATRTR